MSRSAWVIRHLLFEDLGTLEPVLVEHGYAVHYLEAGVDRLDTVLGAADNDLLVVPGGPVGVDDTDAYPYLRAEIDLIRAWVQRERPYLGICLGAQLAAAALGARVYPSGVKEIGFADVTLTAPGRSSALAALDGIPVLHWHGDTFDLPEGAELLASTAAVANQAFRIGRHILCLQFHVEADPAHIERWLIGHAVELAAAGVDPRGVRQDAVEHGTECVTAGRGCLCAWLDALSSS
jgi:GMP synthase (glutamine-hydrolysing)